MILKNLKEILFLSYYFVTFILWKITQLFLGESVFEVLLLKMHFNTFSFTAPADHSW